MININDVDDRDMYRLLMSGKMDGILNGLTVHALNECANLWDALKEDEDPELILRDVLREMADQIQTLRAQYVDDIEDFGADDTAAAEDAGIKTIMIDLVGKHTGLYDGIVEGDQYNSGIVEIEFADNGRVTGFIGDTGQYFLCLDTETGFETFKKPGEL